MAFFARCISGSSLKGMVRGEAEDDEFGDSGSLTTNDTAHNGSKFSSYSWKRLSSKSRSSLGSPKKPSTAPLYSSSAELGGPSMEPVMERTRSALTDLEAVKFLVEDWSQKHWRPATPQDQERFERLEQSDITPLVALGEGAYGSVNLCRIVVRPPSTGLQRPHSDTGFTASSASSTATSAAAAASRQREREKSAPNLDLRIPSAQNMPIAAPTPAAVNESSQSQDTASTKGLAHSGSELDSTGDNRNSGCGRGDDCPSGGSRSSSDPNREPVMSDSSALGNTAACSGSPKQGNVCPQTLYTGFGSTFAVDYAGDAADGPSPTNVIVCAESADGTTQCGSPHIRHEPTSPFAAAPCTVSASTAASAFARSAAASAASEPTTSTSSSLGRQSEAEPIPVISPVTSTASTATNPQLIVAVKRVPLGWSQERELMQLHRCQPCPFIVRLFGFVDDGSEHCNYVMEWAEGGDLSVVLSSLIRRRGTNPKVLLMSEASARYYTACLVLALEFLHGSGLLHRDIKPSNLLITSDGTAKLADLGFTVTLDVKGRTVGCCGTTGYIAPEVYAYGTSKAFTSYGVPADIWSAGATLYQMLTGQVVTDKPAEMLKKGWRPPTHPAFSHSLQDLLNRMLAVKPSARLQGAAAVMRHPWFAQLDWQALREGRLRAPYVPSERRRTSSSSSISSQAATDAAVHAQFAAAAGATVAVGGAVRRRSSGGGASPRGLTRGNSGGDAVFAAAGAGNGRASQRLTPVLESATPSALMETAGCCDASRAGSATGALPSPAAAAQGQAHHENGSLTVRFALGVAECA